MRGATMHFNFLSRCNNFCLPYVYIILYALLVLAQTVYNMLLPKKEVAIF